MTTPGAKIGRAIDRQIARLGAKGRAAGIHVVIATQRPSREVVTGLIKANRVGRVAFRVRSPIESRLILDEAGAERLMGRGDLLYRDIGDSVRLQELLVSDEELCEMAFRGSDVCRHSSLRRHSQEVTRAAGWIPMIQVRVHESATAFG